MAAGCFDWLCIRHLPLHTSAPPLHQARLTLAVKSPNLLVDEYWHVKGRNSTVVAWAVVCAGHIPALAAATLLAHEVCCPRHLRALFSPGLPLCLVGYQCFTPPPHHCAVSDFNLSQILAGQGGPTLDEGGATNPVRGQLAAFKAHEAH